MMVAHGKPPSWIDEEEVIKFVRAEYEEMILFEEQAFANPPWDTVPARPLSEIYSLAEQDAVSAAMRGDIGPLVRMLGSEHPMNMHFGPSVRSNLSPATYALVAEFLSGERNTKNGKPKGEGGAPRKSEDQRRAATPAHNAVDVLPAVEEILRRHWPDQKVRDLAVRIASQIAGAKEDAVHNLIRRSTSDRHRRL